MRKSRMTLAACLACLALLVLTASAQAAKITANGSEIFYDNFEGVAAGGLPDASIWNRIIRTGVTVIDAASPGPAEGDQYLAMTRVGTGAGLLAGSFASCNSGTLHFETMAYIPSEYQSGDHALSIRLGKYNTTTNPVWTDAKIVLLNGGQWYAGTTSTDMLAVANAAGSSYLDTGVNIALDAWQKIEVDVTFDAVAGDSWVLTVEGNSSGPLTLFKNATAPIDALSFATGFDESWWYADAVVPEPATLAMMGIALALFMGGACVKRWNR